MLVFSPTVSRMGIETHKQFRNMKYEHLFISTGQHNIIIWHLYHTVFVLCEKQDLRRAIRYSSVGSHSKLENITPPKNPNSCDLEAGSRSSREIRTRKAQWRLWCKVSLQQSPRKKPTLKFLTQTGNGRTLVTIIRINILAFRERQE